MGMKGNFLTFLQNNAPNAFTYERICASKFGDISVDVSIYLNKYKTIYGQNWRRYFGSFLQFFKHSGIMLWCVFDGVSPIEKKHEHAQRKKNKQRIIDQIRDLELALQKHKETGVVDQILLDLNKKLTAIDGEMRFDLIDGHLRKIKRHVYKLTPEDYEWTSAEIYNMGFVVLTSKTEAEKVCALLCKNKITKACLSDDSDLLGYFCPVILSKFNLATKMCKIINFEILLKTLDMTPAQFLDFCIMCGTDFNKNISGIATQRAFNYIKQYKTIEKFAAETKIDVTILNHTRVRQLYLSI